MEKYKKILGAMKEINPDAIVITGFDDCIIGMANSFDGVRLVYSESKIIEKLSKEMSSKEAWEYYEYNILGGYFSTYNPIFLMDLEEY